MKILHLSLKAKWYRMIESGEKPEEYRDMIPYWAKHLIDTDNIEFVHNAEGGKE